MLRRLTHCSARRTTKATSKKKPATDPQAEPGRSDSARGAIRVLALLVLGHRGVDVEKALGETHFDAARSAIDANQVFLNEGDQHLGLRSSPAGAVHNEQVCAGRAAIDIDNF